jgi:hypothetical protein
MGAKRLYVVRTLNVNQTTPNCGEEIGMDPENYDQDDISVAISEHVGTGYGEADLDGDAA